MQTIPAHRRARPWRTDEWGPLAEVNDLRIHDLRHFATTLLFMEGVPDTIIRKMTGHTSAVMERYKHLDSSFATQSVERIGGRISEKIATFSATVQKIE